MKESYDVTNIVYIHSEKVFGSVEKLGAFASMVRYIKDNLEYEEMLENDDFSIIDEIVFHHVEEKE